ncbi:MAG: hypothetical protein ACR2P6_09840 [Gammaproteobacteria bacterium]
MHTRNFVCAGTAALLAILSGISFAAETETEEKKDKALRIVPLLTSTPLTGTGLGAAASYIYKVDDSDASRSQLQIGAQYSDTESLTTFLRNDTFHKDNAIIGNGLLTWTDINSEFDGSDGRRVEYNIQSFTLRQKFLFEVRDALYLGGLAVYRKIDYSPNNDAGDDFLFDNGIVDEEGVGVGIAGSYDTRVNKYYPRDAWWVDVEAEAFPDEFGADDTFYKLTLNTRYYRGGFAPGDVWASQLYGQYASSKTPDSALPTLSGKSLLRGYPAGQFRARYLSGFQTEYRYQIVDTSFRLIGFAGIAELAGGSYGQGERERDDDGTYWAAGVGARYAIQSRTGVDLRLDWAYTSESEDAIYLALNQAF